MAVLYFYRKENEKMSVNIYDAAHDKLIKLAPLFDREPVIPVGTEYDFEYKGSVEEFEIPETGIWKLEVWGGQGMCWGYSQKAGGKGGYSYGNINLTAGTILNIVVGDGCYGTAAEPVSGTGYNGGGNGYIGKAGGATHIALKDSNGEYNVLSSYVDEQIAGNYVLIVAGGGGAASGGKGGSGGVGGAGGGETGGDGAGFEHNGYAQGGKGGTQSAGGAGGIDSGSGGGVGTAGSFGQGGTANGTSWVGGGGGGWYGGGGGGGHFYEGYVAASGGGGSGYVNSDKLVANTYAMQNGIKEGAGYAKLTFLEML